MKTHHRKASSAKRARRWQADPTAFQRLFARIEPFTAVEVQQLALPPRVAFESLRTGRGEEGDYHTLAAAMNLALVRSEAIDPLCEQTCIDAQHAVLRIGARHERTGLWGLDGTALQAIPPALDLHDQILALSTPAQIDAAAREAVVRMVKGQTLEVVP